MLITSSNSPPEMPFNFRTKTPRSQDNGKQQPQQREPELPKISAAHLSKLTKEFPPWLRDNSCLKQLPGIYLGVLGQVQLQLDITNHEGATQNGLVKTLNRGPQTEYMNRFTDTDRVHQLLSASRLPNDALATIWAHVNKTYPGRLTNREVCFALALIAIFQRLEGDSVSLSFRSKTSKDPFELVKFEKKPPVPKLYPRDSSKPSRISTSQSIPERLNDNGADVEDGGGGILLIDIHCDRPLSNRSSFHSGATTMGSNPYNLIDNDNDQLGPRIQQYARIWMLFLTAMKRNFKRTYDILMVENSRQNSLDALGSERGKIFIKNLCLCYPLAYNIKFKIDELKKFRPRETHETSEQKLSSCLLDKDYVSRADDLMTSINEYWAVLINLFHASGQTEFIEHIMDRLNYKTGTIISQTLGELNDEFNSIGKADLCSICLMETYLSDIKTEPVPQTVDKFNPTMNVYQCVENEIITNDSQYYYHAKCANFWLNYVDPKCELPFVFNTNLDILSPTKTN